MKVTKVAVSTANVGKICAFVDVTYDDVLTVKGLKLVNGAKGMFLAMPAQKKEEQWVDQVMLGAELKTATQEAAIKAYETHTANAGSTAARPNRNNPSAARLANDLDDLGAPPLE